MWACFLEDLVASSLAIGAETRQFGEEFGDAAVDGGEDGGGSRDGVFNGGFPAPTTVVVATDVLD